MLSIIDPAPRIIRVGDTKERMLAELRAQIVQEGGDPDAPVTLSPEQEVWDEEFSALLEQSVQDIEDTYNVRVVE
jgi:hypothetical protein